jgi:hypothetical protein
MVRDFCRWPEPETCGETTTAVSRIAGLEAMTRPVDSLARSSGSCVITADSEP